MKYVKIINDGYITAIGTNMCGTDITESEYNDIISVVKNCPNKEGKAYRLKTDLTWEEYTPEEPVEEPTDEVSDAEFATALREVLDT